MTIAAGTKVGSYEILAAIGAGGMGEVYRARDAKLGRDVALKVLPAAFARDTERMARFQREAKVLASMNHPNIATIHGLEDSSGSYALVMELVEGPTLADRIKQGPIPIDEALKIAKQICEALEYAHERGIVHRDLKPANIKVTNDDAVKVLDFGLAKAIEGDPSSIDISSSPTMSRLATMQGVLLGTAAYMSPEQAKAKVVDRRADIWAFGCVFYEMLAGKMAFSGETVTDTLAAVIRADPDWSLLPAATPLRVRVLLQRCLQKDPKQRLQAIGDARISIDEVLSGAPEPSSISEAAAPARAPLWRRALPWAAACLLGALIGALATWSLKPSGPAAKSQPIARLAVTLAPDQELAGIGYIALSPDGTQLVFVALRDGVPQLYVRSIDRLENRPMEGTEGGLSPFFSPDGQWVAFFADDKLKKIPITGGSPLVVCDAAGSGGLGGTWGADGTIYFTHGTSFSEIWQVSAEGGTPRPFTKLDRQKGEISHRWPQVLPGGKAVLFTVWTGPGWDEMQVQLQMVGSGERRVLVQGGRDAFYSPTGHLIYARAGKLMAVPFDLDRLQVAGNVPFSVGENILDTGEGAEYTLSADGSLAYVPGTPQQFDTKLVWVDRKGSVEPLAADPHHYESVAISPNGQEAALTVGEAKVEIWIYDFQKGISTRLATGASSQFPIWTPDGKRLTYRLTRAGARNLFWSLADGSGSEEQLTTGDGNRTPGSWSPDGQVLAITTSDATGAHIIGLRLSDRKMWPLVEGAALGRDPDFSPDGHWLAYVSFESGRSEVYVQAYPGPSGKWQVSTNGGAEPLWNRNGRELFYRDGDRMMAVDVRTQPSFSAAKPKMLFEEGFIGGYDISPDGQRFLMIKGEQTSSKQINFVLNWTEELKRLVPTGK